jgi:hypothetical protein
MANGPHVCPLAQMASATAEQAVGASALPLESAAASAVALPSTPEAESPPDPGSAPAETPPDPGSAPALPPNAPPAPIAAPAEPAPTSIDHPASVETAPPAPAFVAPPLPALSLELVDEPLQDTHPMEISDQTTISLITTPRPAIRSCARAPRGSVETHGDEPVAEQVSREQGFSR